IKSCEDISSQNELVTTNRDIIFTSKFTKPIATLLLSNKDQIIATVVLHFVILSSLGEISQFRDGLLKIEGM
uniref:Uncharacterized protein n=1 Tax=Amphimedon queenslandica TaxID=400682 RepID=A0A1X7VW50_AMPQE